MKKMNRDEGRKSRGISQSAATTSRTAEKNISLTVNGKLYQLMVGKDVNPDHTLAYTLRETLGYTGTKIACDHGGCGACTVLMDREAVLSCTILTVECDGKNIITIEGLANAITGELHPLQQAFIDYSAFQCGFCMGCGGLTIDGCDAIITPVLKCCIAENFEVNMDFEFSEDQKMLQTMVRDFATKELEPIAAQIDEEARYPAENLKKAAELGLFGIGFPEQYGGAGGGAIERAILNEELARVCASAAIIINGSIGLAGVPLYKYGNEEQRQRFVVPIAKGEKLGTFAITESGAGSDIAAMETTATRHKNGYILNGTKILISQGSMADITLVFATVDKSLRHRGITCFIVETGTPGFSVGRLEHKMGVRGSPTAELTFEDCFLPAENRLGDEGQGFRIALSTLDACRPNAAATGLGIAQGAFDKALAYAQERKQFDQPIANFQAIQWMLADMATQIDAARLLIYRAAHRQDTGLPSTKESSMAKLFAAEAAAFVTTKAVQIHGGYGYIKDYPVERYFRDARVVGLFDGTDEMQRLTIARQLLRPH